MLRSFNSWRSVPLIALALVGAFAQAGEWEFRLRSMYIDPANRSSAIPALAVPNNAITVSTKWTPELDLTYRFNDRWSVEVIASPLLEHSVTVEQSALGGPTRIGSFKHLPPTFSAQYRFLPGSTVRPYVALGLNATWLSDVRLEVPTVGRLALDRWSFGPSVQVGFNWNVDDRWHLNADLKRIWIESAVFLGEQRISAVQVDPFVYAIGVGYRFGAR